MNPDNWENETFENLLRERLKDGGFNLKKLSERTGISVKYLEAMVAGNFEKLPAAPYLRGYVKKLGEVLDFDSDEWWKRLKENSSVNTGAHSLIAKNRFIKKHVPKIAWALGVLIAILIYVYFRYSNISGKPVLTLTNPQSNPATATESQITLVGIVKNGNELYINGESIPLGQNGEWQKPVLLQSGINSLEITAKKTIGSETKILEQIIYTPQPTTSSATSSKP